ncbi:E3 ubiquitin-protein ligase TRIM71-like [Oopsacas minuta]|uniref:E3 ubiquitin-protein ligase TRIM71-like n=1 Tax=Oopsacas minuta TaxID=111878 RepID=A0AAV7JGS0_9METZ|nr:E3 ubiquitin-protein ligase TRIM71-like [Oopsacas minuta]
MATRVPAEVELIEGNEWERELEILVEQVQHEKDKVRDIFQQLHSLLAVREQSLLVELDDVVVRARLEVKEKIDVIQELQKAKEALDKELTKNKLREVLQKNLSTLDEKIREEKGRGVNVRWVDLEWKREQLEQSIIEVCKVVTFKEKPFRTEDYSRKLRPVWSREGTGPSRIEWPDQIAIDPISENIYIVDSKAHNIKIFNKEGKYLYNISTPKNPSGIALTNEFIYVSAGKTIVKIGRSNNKTTKSVKLENSVFGMDIYTNNTLYVCEQYNLSILLLDMELKVQNRIILNTPHVTDRKSITSIKLYQDNMYVKFNNSLFHLQIFRLDGELVRCIIEETEILFCNFFTIDQFGNIITPNYFRNEIKIFSNSGKLIHTISNSNLAEDEMFDCPIEVAIGKNNRIIIAQHSEKYNLIAF